MLVGSLVDLKDEIALKKEWTPSAKVRAYCDLQYSEFKQDQYQYQKSYRVFNNRTPSEYFRIAEDDAFKFVDAPIDPNDWRNFIRSGEERNKEDGLLSFLRDLNFRVEPELRDWAGEVSDNAGHIAEAYLRLLNVLDDSEENDALTDFCMFTHGTVFKQVKLDVKKILRKMAAEWNPKDGIDDTYNPKMKEEDGRVYVLSKVLKPNRVYLADVTKLSSKDQPHIWYEAVVPYAIAYGMFHSYKQWKFVKPYNATVDTWTDSETDVETESRETPDKVRIRWRESEGSNELSIYCNKVLMTPPGLALPEGCYSVFYQQASILHPFMSYGRSFMDNVRPFVAVKDVLTSILVDKSRQLLEPPMKSRFRTMVNRYMFKPGNVTPMQGEGDFTPLIPESAIQSFVFEAIKVYDDMVNKSSISPVFQGQQTKAQMTKYEVEQQFMQSIRAVAGMVGAAAAWRKQQAYLQLKVGLNHIEDITDFRFEVPGAFSDVSKIVELRKDMPNTRQKRYEALNELMKAEGAYRKAGRRKKIYVSSPTVLRGYSAVINMRVNPQQRDSRAGDEQEIKTKIDSYRGDPLNINQRAVSRMLVKMHGDDEEEILMPEHPAAASPEQLGLGGQPTPGGVPQRAEPTPGTQMPQFAKMI